MKNRIRDFIESIVRTITASGAVTGGAPTLVGTSHYGIAAGDIADAALGSLVTRGDFTLPKATGASTAMAAWTPVSVSAGNCIPWTPSLNTPLLGWTTAACLDGDATVPVTLAGPDLFSQRVRVGKRTVSSGEAAAAGGNGLAQVDALFGTGVTPSFFIAQVRSSTGTPKITHTVAIDGTTKAFVFTGAGTGNIAQNDVLTVIAVQ